MRVGFDYADKVHANFLTLVLLACNLKLLVMKHALLNN